MLLRTEYCGLQLSMYRLRGGRKQNNKQSWPTVVARNTFVCVCTYVHSSRLVLLLTNVSDETSQDARARERKKRTHETLYIYYV